MEESKIMKAIKKQLLAMSIALAVVLLSITPAEKTDLSNIPGICAINAQNTSQVPLEDKPDIPKPRP